MAAAAAPARFDGMSSKQLVRLWEEFIDRDVVAAREVFFRALLRDAAAEYNKQEAAAAAARGAAGEEEGQDRGYQRERFLLRPCSTSTPREASPPAPEPPMVVLCLRAAPPRPPTPTPHLAVGGRKRDALCRLDATAEHKQAEVVARPAAAAGADGGGGAGEDRGHPPPHERLSSPPSEPAPIAPMVVLCLRAATAPPLQASRRRGASDHAR
uniref:Uncharacterized protein n=1 Tax=Oryza rufipogon TaxID=4529 RepID=A0A0E0NW11_ORYRU